MVKKKTDKKDVVPAPAVLLEKPKPKRTPRKAKPTPPLTAARLRALAAKHKPPQSWFEEDLDGI